MQQIFQSAKRLISIILVTLFLITSTLLSFPAPAKAAGDVVMLKCESDCNGVVFAEGVASGAVVALIATGKAATLGGVVATVGHVATAIAAPTLGGAAVAAASVVAPVAATAAVGYLGYQVWETYHHSHAQSSS